MITQKTNPISTAVQSWCQLDSVRQFANRVIFQLDLTEDKLRYCCIANTFDEERSEGIIDDFRQALESGVIVHPEDVNTCHRIMEHPRNDGLITSSVIRLFRASHEYQSYRIYTISTNNLKGELLAIHGMLEGVQPEKSMHRQAEKEQYHALFRQAVTRHAILSMGFDCATGDRLSSDLDVLPPWMPQDAKLKNVAILMFSHAVHPEEQNRLESLVEQSLNQTHEITRQSFYEDYKLRDLSRQTSETRWYRVCHSFTQETKEQHACFYMTIVDIQDTKRKEQQAIEELTHDQLTGLLNRNAFERELPEWLQRMKRESAYPYIGVIVILIDNPIEIIHRYGRDYLEGRVVQVSKTINAFIHPYEMCSKHGLSEFALAIAGDSRETLDERIRMLRMIGEAYKGAQTHYQICFGCNIEPAAQVTHCDLFLEKACQELLHTRKVETSAETDVSPVEEVATDKGKNRMESLDVIVPPVEELKQPNVFIRTFGHFDVFVNEEAVLFNHPKAKELLALLVDRRGGFVSASEAISCLWEEEPANKTTLARCRKAALQMKQTLRKYGIDSIIATVNGKRRILTDQCYCDYYQYLRNGADASRKPMNSYMNEYSWAESTKASE